MGNFEKLSVLVIVVIIVMILFVAIYTWTDNPDNSATTDATGESTVVVIPGEDEDGRERPSGGGFVTPTPPNPWVDVFGRDQDGDDTVDPDPDPIPKPISKPDPKPDPKPKPVTDVTSTELWMYTVKKNDSLSLIAQDHLGTIHRQGEITDLNPGLDPLRLRIGQQLKMPARGQIAPNPPHSADKLGSADKTDATKPAATGGPTPGSWYVTRNGDTLEKISKRAFRSKDYWPEIWAKNLSVLDAPEDMRAGLRLFIPKVQKFN